MSHLIVNKKMREETLKQIIGDWLRLGETFKSLGCRSGKKKYQDNHR